MKISEPAQKLHDFLPPISWMTERNLAQAISVRAQTIKTLKEELEAARLIYINFCLNKKRFNPRHEIIKTSGNGSPIYKRIENSYCFTEWGNLDRNSLIECFIKSDLPILPFAERDKSPIAGFCSLDWKRTPPQEKMDFFFNHPKLNVGLVVCAHMLVIDIDSKHNEWSEHESFQNTLNVSTAKGAHYYFRKDPVVTTSTKILPDVDIRGSGNYVVIPPSIHSSGVPYQFENLLKPAYLPIEFRQAWCQSEFEMHRSSGNSSLPPIIIYGTRNDTLWRYGRGLRARGKNFYEIEALIRECNRSRCQPPLDGVEMERLLKNIWTRPNRINWHA